MDIDALSPLHIPSDAVVFETDGADIQHTDMLEDTAPLASHTELYSVTQLLAEAGEAVDQPASLQLLTATTDPSPADPSSANPNSEVPHDGTGATTGALKIGRASCRERV